MVVLTQSTKEYNYKYLGLFKDLRAAVNFIYHTIAEENQFLVAAEQDEETASFYISNGTCYDIFYNEGVRV